MFKQIKKLKSGYQYKKCRDLILSIKDYKKNPELLLALAECYYKDNELYYKYSYKKALNLFKNKIFKKATNEQKKERLNLIGAIYKRYWEKEKNINYLLKSIQYYEKAWNRYKYLDKGYGGVNVANLYDELGKLLNNKCYYKKANDIRNEIVRLLDVKLLCLKNNLNLNLKKFKFYIIQEWDYHTLITTYFGLGEFNQVLKYLEKTKKDDEWQRYTTYETCYKLNKLKNLNADSILEKFFGNIFDITKVGLALSGGGFRASLFHLGSLVALAKADRLKDISVISTVSGGSIIGVLYYLKVKELLENKKDEYITKKDYLDLLDELIQEFLSVITTKNIRNEVFGLDIIISLTRTQKIAKLYDKYFYSKYEVKYLKDLLITPKRENNFNPHFQNFKRKNKVPIIVINTTNLNNGHNFQFHTTKMGETISSEYDNNFQVDFLREGCDVYDNFLVSEAVAASSAVPGLFPALKVKLGEVEINLVDGGVYENIGLNAMFSENVDEIIVSDGGYEMNNLKKLSFSYSLKLLGLASYMSRSIDVLMDINKDLNYEKINTKKILNILSNSREYFEIDCKNNEFKESNNLTEYFSKIRTDLDKFSKIEANTIIYFGYKNMMNKLNNPKCNYKYDFEDVEVMWDTIELKEIIKEADKMKIWR